MKTLVTTLIALCSISAANANIVKHEGYLKFINPVTGEAKMAWNPKASSGLIKSKDVQIVSGNLIRHDGFFKLVDLETGEVRNTWANMQLIKSSELNE